MNDVYKNNIKYDYKFLVFTLMELIIKIIIAVDNLWEWKQIVMFYL